MSAQSLILFDIDGTLVLTGRAGLRAMVYTLETEFGVAEPFSGVSMGGRTDTSLVSDAFAHAGIEDTVEHHRRFRDAYLRRLAHEILLPGTGTKAVMPGVRALLDRARTEPRLHVALLTGNYRDAAAIKLGHFALADYFTWGAFADDAADRNALVPIARARARERLVPPEACTRVVVIGDTPHDVTCAAVAGARSIAVATGGHSRDELAAAGADIVLDDLSDTERVLGLLL